jgi:hypothetical protein
VFTEESRHLKIKTHIKATSSTQFGLNLEPVEHEMKYLPLYSICKNQLRLDKVIKMRPQI